MTDADTKLRFLTGRLRALSEVGDDPKTVTIREAADEIDRLRAEVEALRKDAERWRWGVAHAAWHRNEDRSHIAIPVAKDADLSCLATRVMAIDAAMGKT